MVAVSFGDGARQLAALRQTQDLKTRLATLSAELSSGQSSDLARHIGTDLPRLAGFDRGLTLIDGFAQAAQQTGQMLDMMQTSLQAIDARRADLMQNLTTVTDATSEDQVSLAAEAGKTAFSDIVGKLNARLNDRTAFAGTATGGPALADPDQMLTQIRSATSGAQTAAEAEAAVTAWFDDPAGGFATGGYLGDTGAPAQRRIDDTTKVDITARADAPALRDVMKAAAMAALATGDVPALSRMERVRLLQASGNEVASAAQPLATLQASLGMAEASVADTQAALGARKTYITTARNDMVSADPFETATKLQAVQTALETHFTVIARLSHLRLSEYLR